jgi:hypothetical protein
MSFLGSHLSGVSSLKVSRFRGSHGFEVSSF